MEYLISALLGAVAGITEFVPVSAPIHLRLASQIFHIDLSNSFWKLHLVAIQLGTVVALLALYIGRSRNWRQALQRGIAAPAPGIPAISLIGWAFLSTIISSFLLSTFNRRAAKSPQEMGMSLLLGSVAMWATDSVVVKASIRGTGRMSPLQAVWIGLCQSLSLAFPGTSRSMATISGGQLSGLARPVAVEFSYLLFAPTMLSETFVELHQIQPMAGISHVSVRGFGLLALGFLTATLTAYLSANWMLKWVVKHGLSIFAAYSACLGSALLLLITLHSR